MVDPWRESWAWMRVEGERDALGLALGVCCCCGGSGLGVPVSVSVSVSVSVTSPWAINVGMRSWKASQTSPHGRTACRPCSSHSE